MVEEPLITEEARAMVGREYAPIIGHIVTEHEIKQYCYAVDNKNPLYIDAEIAQKGPYGGIIAPPLFHSVPFNKWAPLTEIKEDGISPAGPGPLTVPLPVKRFMVGATDVECLGLVRPGDILTCKRKIIDMYERTGKSGNKMVFVIYESTYSNQNNELVAIERLTGIFR